MESVFPSTYRAVRYMTATTPASVTHRNDPFLMISYPTIFGKDDGTACHSRIKQQSSRLYWKGVSFPSVDDE